jgi:hypothetical protein
MFPLTRRSATPTAPTHQSAGGYQSFRTMIGNVIDACRGASAQATTRNAEQERSQSIHPQQGYHSVTTGSTGRLAAPGRSYKHANPRLCRSSRQLLTALVDAASAIPLLQCERVTII